jgi:hypothetical protein
MKMGVWKPSKPYPVVLFPMHYPAKAITGKPLLRAGNEELKRNKGKREDEGTVYLGSRVTVTSHADYCSLSLFQSMIGQQPFVIYIIFHQRAKRYIAHVHSIPEAALEPIAIEQGHKKLEVFFLSVVGRCGH